MVHKKKSASVIFFSAPFCFFSLLQRGFATVFPSADKRMHHARPPLLPFVVQIGRLSKNPLHFVDYKVI
jgi:hypothetical protein